MYGSKDIYQYGKSIIYKNENGATATVNNVVFFGKDCIEITVDIVNKKGSWFRYFDDKKAMLYLKKRGFVK